jgi:retron-type reverse transcriptase
MRRHGNLYERICAFENLVTAAYCARRGKRFRPDVAAFHFYLEAELLSLRDELRTRAYQPGPYRAFHIRDPKPRLISAAAYRDRVVHHALCQVIEPLFTATFIHDSYANRLGKGTHKALERCTSFARRHTYVLKCDIEKYFPSIDHEHLFVCLARKIKCPDTLWLIRCILKNSNPQEEVIRYFPGDTLFTPMERRRGIPIGNLTSQFFANVYLNGFDHYAKQTLGCRAYLRFADDFLVFANDKTWLAELLPRLQTYLDRLRLRLHPRKCQVMPTRCGVEFLGWLVYPHYRRLRHATGMRFQRRLRVLQQDYASGRATLHEVRASIMSSLGHLRHGATWGLRRKLLEAAPFVKAAPPSMRGARI